MSEVAIQLLNSVLALPEAERVEFRDALDEALHDAGPDAEFDALIARRVQEIRSGRVKALPGDEFFIRLRSQG